jgi:short-subunit dehydrogenase
MDRQGGGSIINISSVASIRYSGVPYATYYATPTVLADTSMSGSTSTRILSGKLPRAS